MMQISYNDVYMTESAGKGIETSVHVCLNAAKASMRCESHLA